MLVHFLWRRTYTEGSLFKLFLYSQSVCVMMMTDWVSWLPCWQLWYVFRRCLVWVFARTLNYSEMFLGFPQTHQSDATILPLSNLLLLSSTFLWNNHSLRQPIHTYIVLNIYSIGIKPWRRYYYYYYSFSTSFTSKFCVLFTGVLISP
jgi:hypothetical protein